MLACSMHVWYTGKISNPLQKLARHDFDNTTWKMWMIITYLKQIRTIFIFSIDEYDILVINPATEVCTYLNKLIDKYISVQYIFVDMTYLSLSLYSLLSLFYIPTQQLKPLLYIDQYQSINGFFFGMLIIWKVITQKVMWLWTIYKLFASTVWQHFSSIGQCKIGLGSSVFCFKMDMDRDHLIIKM